MINKIKIVPPKIEYAELMFKWRNESETVKYNPLKDRTLEELRTNLSEAPTTFEPFDQNTTYRWFILLDNGKLVGTVSVGEVNSMMKTAMVGYMIGEEYQGKGIATAALKLWTTMIFEKTDLRRLTASVAEGNLASLRVLEKVGYVREGLLREHFLIQNKPVNEVFFGLLRREWSSD